MKYAISGRIPPAIADTARARGGELRDWAGRMHQHVKEDILPAAASRLREADEEYQIRERGRRS